MATDNMNLFDDLRPYGDDSWQTLVMFWLCEDVQSQGTLLVQRLSCRHCLNTRLVGRRYGRDQYTPDARIGVQIAELYHWLVAAQGDQPVCVSTQST
jgi:hypothetical protein